MKIKLTKDYKCDLKIVRKACKVFPTNLVPQCEAPEEFVKCCKALEKGEYYIYEKKEY